MKMSLLACLLLLAPVVGAQPVAKSPGPDYPSKAIRLIVPFPPGGPNDILGRLIAQKLSERFAQPVVIDNRGGAGGIVGAELAAHATGDGYTLLFAGTASLSINPNLQKSLPYDPIKDFAPVSLVGIAPSILVAHPAVPIKTIKDLITLAKAKPGYPNFASAGIGTPPHLAGAMFNSMAGVSMTHIPYKGGGPALTELLAGQVSIYFSGISAALPLVKEGRLAGIAVTSAKRTAVTPDLPTIAESGLAGYEVSNWYAIVAPAATPKAIVTRLNSEIVRVLGAADVKKRFLDLAADPLGSTPEELAAYRRSELAKWAKVIKSAGITPE